MKKRLLPVFLIFLLLTALVPTTALASGGLSNFVKTHTYKSGYFKDVAVTDWFTPYVQASYEYGLISGKGAGRFDPNGRLTLAEAVKLAACIHEIYYNGAANFSNGSPWYRPYADEALNAGILDVDYPNYDAPATRSEFALILSKALPAEALAVKNRVDDNAVPDVPLGFTYSDAVYELYRAGVLTGCDTTGAFRPNNTITRAEAASIVTRMANAAFRRSQTLKLSLTAEQLYKKCAPAVFYILIYDVNGKAVKSGSGFFIDGDGTAVTNYHVIVGASKAVVTTADGKEYNVSGVYDYSEERDLALIQVDGTGFASLALADGDVRTGAAAFAIGSPFGLKNSFSEGLVSYAARNIGGQTYIQTTAAISSGSSGGALLDASGKVLGVTTATATGAQNLNIAVPAGEIQSLDKDTLQSFASILPDTVYYNAYFPAPDFGAVVGSYPFLSQPGDDAMTYYYAVDAMNVPVDDALASYEKLLEQNCFSFFGYTIEESGIISYYINGSYNILLSVGYVTYNGVDSIRIELIQM
ncbi:trypsin-like peptidase domain-containing protein [Oscillospiraceae bacterium CM]|nr:trypsin-like peptidase domain-containing protein [Oscillospiraceae bacterium CM]